MAKRKRDEAHRSEATTKASKKTAKISAQPDTASRSIKTTPRHAGAVVNGSNGLGKRPNGTSLQASKTTSTSESPARSEILRTQKHADVKSDFPTIQIITGSYERVLHGISANISLEDDSPKATFADSFLFNAHASAVRCLALSPMPEDSSQGIYLATGGSDERVNVYSLSASPMPEADSKGRKVPSMPSLGPNKVNENPMNRELGTLVQHSSSVTALHFPSRSKLLSASEDNTIAVTRVRDLEVVSTVKAPRPKVAGQASGDSTDVGITPAGVNDFAVHPSMKLMVSVGRGEKSMRLWNLVTGKKAGVLNFDRAILQAVKEGKYSHGEGRKIKWNRDGTEFAIAFERGVVVFGQDSKPKCALVPQRLTKVHQIDYFTVDQEKQLLAVSTEDGKVLFFDPTQAPESQADIPVLSPVAYMGGEKQSIRNRIKDFQILDLAKHGFPGYLLVVGCSNGDVRLLMLNKSELLKPIAGDGLVGTAVKDVYGTGSRITCLVAFVMLPPHDIEGGLSEAESALGSEVDSEDSSEGE
ncbi:Protein mak11 [Exophiala xenobiotica]|uniref:Protein mak11 n=1 Tax=Lithohypha guttulata TaxID=1690604 RepID=A0ABR0KCU1_9EURO|nr:Protein mak11 [Lithohypha guttulata]KAK5320367.1 Protein mak11 [Exophiala xenobiotica]